MTSLNLDSLTGHQQERLHALLAEEAFQKDTLPKILSGDGERPGPLYWLQHTRTFDEKWREHGFGSPYQPFPNYPFLSWLFGLFLNEPRLMVAKSREMLLSWSVIAYAVWLCETRPRSRVMVQTEKLDKGIALVNGAGVGGYARTLWEQQSERLRLEFPLSKPSEDQPGERLSWASGSIIQAVPSGEDQIRSFHPTLAIYDEATYLTGFGASWEAAESVCEQMIAISSVGPSTFWDIVRPGAEGVSHG